MDGAHFRPQGIFQDGKRCERDQGFEHVAVLHFHAMLCRTARPLAWCTLIMTPPADDGDDEDRGAGLQRLESSNQQQQAGALCVTIRNKGTADLC